ncbi:MAG: glycosyltransferase family 9 protein [Rhodospirillaceae bacterium]|nr:glycosyltransferase family 9 protein [Rhodospirillaceae bacterium]
MNIDTMRRIDYFAGVPLCFLLSIVSRETKSPGGQVPENVLFLELSEMGSTVLADPAMKKAERDFGSKLHFAIFDTNRPGLALSKSVPDENIFVIRDDSFLHLALDSLGFLLWTRRKRIDTVFDLELFSRFSALLTGLSGATNRVGFHAFHNEGLYRGNLLTHKVAYNPYMHIAKNFIALVNAAGAEKPEYPYSKTLIGDDEIDIHKVTPGTQAIEATRAGVRSVYPAFDGERHRIVLINSNASQLLPQRRWPEDRYGVLIERILSDFDDVIVLITGAPSERAEAEQLSLSVGHERCLNFAGNIAFEELTALYSISALMVTNDSGPAHFASLTDMPVVVLFGPETPNMYKPLGRASVVYAGIACSPCVSAANHRKTTCMDNICMAAISVEQVYFAVKAEIRGKY